MDDDGGQLDRWTWGLTRDLNYARIWKIGITEAKERGIGRGDEGKEACLGIGGRGRRPANTAKLVIKE